MPAEHDIAQLIGQQRAAAEVLGVKRLGAVRVELGLARRVCLCLVEVLQHRENTLGCELESFHRGAHVVAEVHCSDGLGTRRVGRLVKEVHRPRKELLQAPKEGIKVGVGCLVLGGRAVLIHRLWRFNSLDIRGILDVELAFEVHTTPLADGKVRGEKGEDAPGKDGVRLMRLGQAAKQLVAQPQQDQSFASVGDHILR